MHIKSSYDAFVAGLKVLVVDDEPQTVKIAEAMLQALGVAKVLTANTAAEAVTRLQNDPRTIDCVLSDVHMPGGSGLQLLRAVRLGQVRGIRPDFCVILMSQSTDADTVRTAAQLDVNGYILKPLSRSALEVAMWKGRRKAFAVDFARYSALGPSAVMMPA
jgi:CheY-like chemotaxis protein